jgi:hypothetical protein
MQQREYFVQELFGDMGYELGCGVGKIKNVLSNVHRKLSRKLPEPTKEERRKERIECIRKETGMKIEPINLSWEEQKIFMKDKPEFINTVYKSIREAQLPKLPSPFQLFLKYMPVPQPDGSIKMMEVGSARASEEERKLRSPIYWLREGFRFGYSEKDLN